jgi:hypothetical protein
MSRFGFQSWHSDAQHYDIGAIGGIDQDALREKMRSLSLARDNEATAQVAVVGETAGMEDEMAVESQEKVGNVEDSIDVPPLISLGNNQVAVDEVGETGNIEQPPSMTLPYSTGGLYPGSAKAGFVGSGYMYPNPGQSYGVNGASGFSGMYDTSVPQTGNIGRTSTESQRQQSRLSTPNKVGATGILGGETAALATQSRSLMCTCSNCKAKNGL